MCLSSRPLLLTVLLPQPSISEEIYTAVMTAGLCMWTAAGKAEIPLNTCANCRADRAKVVICALLPLADADIANAANGGLVACSTRLLGDNSYHLPRYTFLTGLDGNLIEIDEAINWEGALRRSQCNTRMFQNSTNELKSCNQQIGTTATLQLNLPQTVGLPPEAEL